MRRPVSIQIAAVVWLVYFSIPVVKALGHPIKVIAFFLSLVLVRALVVGYCVISLWRMSRWPVVALAVLTVLDLVTRYAVNPHWTDRYPILGAFAALGLPVFVLALVLPHWNKLNWKLFGAAPSAPAVSAEDVF